MSGLNQSNPISTSTRPFVTLIDLMKSLADCSRTESSRYSGMVGSSATSAPDAVRSIVEQNLRLFEAKLGNEDTRLDGETAFGLFLKIRLGQHDHHAKRRSATREHCKREYGAERTRDPFRSPHGSFLFGQARRV